MHRLLLSRGSSCCGCGAAGGGAQQQARSKVARQLGAAAHQLAFSPGAPPLLCGGQQVYHRHYHGDNSSNTCTAGGEGAGPAAGAAAAQTAGGILSGSHRAAAAGCTPALTSRGTTSSTSHLQHNHHTRHHHTLQQRRHLLLLALPRHHTTPPPHTLHTAGAAAAHPTALLSGGAGTAIAARPFHASAAARGRRGGASALEPRQFWRKKSKAKINKRRGLREKQHGAPGSRLAAERARRLLEGASATARALVPAAAREAEDAKFAGFIEELLAPAPPDDRLPAVAAGAAEAAGLLLPAPGRGGALQRRYLGPQGADRLWKEAREAAAATADARGAAERAAERVDRAEAAGGGGGGLARLRAAAARAAGVAGAAEEAAQGLYSRMLKALLKEGRHADALVVARGEMRASRVRANAYAVEALLMAAGRAGDGADVDAIWRNMRAEGVKPARRTWNMLLHALYQHGRVDDALAAGEAMRTAGVPWSKFEYSTLLAALVSAARYDDAWKMYREMVSSEVERDAHVLTTMMRACARQCQFERTWQLMDEMDARGLQPGQGTFNALLRAAATSTLWMRAYGDMVDRIRARMRGAGVPPNQFTWQSLLHCYGNHGDADGVRRTLAEMLEWAATQPPAAAQPGPRPRVHTGSGGGSSSSGGSTAAALLSLPLDSVSGDAGAAAAVAALGVRDLTSLPLDAASTLPAVVRGGTGRGDAALPALWSEGAAGLSVQTISAAVGALAGCMSCGEPLGTRPRYGCLPEHAEEMDKWRNAHRMIRVTRRERELLEEMRLATLDYDRDAEEAATGRNRAPGAARQKFKGMTHVEDARTEEAHEEYKAVLAEIVARADARERGEPVPPLLAAGRTSASAHRHLPSSDDSDSQGEEGEERDEGEAGERRVVVRGRDGHLYRDWSAEATDVETLIEELRLEHEAAMEGGEEYDSDSDDEDASSATGGDRPRRMREYTSEDIEALAEELRAEARGDFEHLLSNVPDGDDGDDPQWRAVVERLRRRRARREMGEDPDAWDSEEEEDDVEDEGAYGDGSGELPPHEVWEADGDDGDYAGGDGNNAPPGDGEMFTIDSHGRMLSGARGPAAFDAEVRRTAAAAAAADGVGVSSDGSGGALGGMSEEEVLAKMAALRAARARPGGITEADLECILGPGDPSAVPAETDETVGDGGGAGGGGDVPPLNVDDPLHRRLEAELFGDADADGDDVSDDAGYGGDGEDADARRVLREAALELVEGGDAGAARASATAADASPQRDGDDVLARLLAGEDADIDLSAASSGGATGASSVIEVAEDGRGGWDLVSSAPSPTGGGERGAHTAAPALCQGALSSRSGGGGSGALALREEDEFALMRMPLEERRYHIAAYAQEAYEAALAVHGPPPPMLLNQMLRVHAEALDVDAAFAFLDTEFPRHGIAPDVKTARALVRMLCRARRPADACALERRARAEWGIGVDGECLGMVLNEWSKRDDHGAMARVLDDFAAAGVRPPEKWLYFTRRNARLARFEHHALPPDPAAYLARRAAAVRARPRQEQRAAQAKIARRGGLRARTSLY